MWFLFFPEARSGFVVAIKESVQWVNRRIGMFQQNTTEVWRLGSSRLGESADHHFSLLFRHRLLVALVAFILLVPTLLVLGLRQNVELRVDAVQTSADQTVSALVVRLLAGEQLVPPPPLPPDVFMTEQVLEEVPELHLDRANRDWERLDAQFRQRLLAVFEIMRERYGYQMVMIEGYRSPERQTQLAGEGSHVTRASAGRSYHQYGLAADCAFYREGKLVISARSDWARQAYRTYGQVAEAAGLIWGGSWRSIRDLGHVELHARDISSST